MKEQRAITEMVSKAEPGEVFVPGNFAEAGLASLRYSDA